MASIQIALDDPPPVHTSGVMSHAPSGVWHTERSAYELLARCCQGDTLTLETGCGVSTVMFARWGASHTCITPSHEEVDRLRRYCDSRDISLERVEFLVGPSDEILPSLKRSDPLDVVLVDGGHAFPLAIIDWYYAGRRLRSGGIMLIDDIHLPSVSTSLVPYLNRDPRWQCIARTQKWTAYHRLSNGSLSDEWGLQAGLGIFPEQHRASAVTRAALERGAAYVRSRVRRAR